jgi:hypothetical protein
MCAFSTCPWFAEPTHFFPNESTSPVAALQHVLEKVIIGRQLTVGKFGE